MAITNREILQNQVRRIKEKTGSNLELHFTRRFAYLYEVKEEGVLKNFAFGSADANRTSAQMFEYLAGMEVAIDARPQRVYFIRCEVNDHGWHTGGHHFARLEDAIKLMRNHVAWRIWHARENGKKVFLKIFSDSVMGDMSKNPQRSQTIFIRIGEDTFEYRVWTEELHYSELPKDKCFNY